MLRRAREFNAGPLIILSVRDKEDRRDLRVVIGQIRHKIEPDPAVLTEPGIGYRLDV